MNSYLIFVHWVGAMQTTYILVQKLPTLYPRSFNGIGTRKTCLEKYWKVAGNCLPVNGSHIFSPLFSCHRRQETVAGFPLSVLHLLQQVSHLCGLGNVLYVSTYLSQEKVCNIKTIVGSILQNINFLSRRFITCGATSVGTISVVSIENKLLLLQFLPYH